MCADDDRGWPRREDPNWVKHVIWNFVGAIALVGLMAALIALAA
jgi:hypothetical protein